MKIEILNFCIFQALLFFYCSNLKLCHSTDIFELIPEKNEYLIEYKNYLSKHSRLRILKNFFDLNFIKNYHIKDKISYFSTFPSDFDVVFVNDSFDSWIFPEEKNNFIAHIHVHKRLQKNINLNNLNAKNQTFCKAENINRKLLQLDKEFDVKKRKIKKLKKLRSSSKLIDQLKVKYLWRQGITGKGINVAIFDTGLRKNHPNFKNVIERIDFTDEYNPDDTIGHGTFVCGLIASQKECLGIAPDANIYIFKVFTKNQISYTSWFLDAFNYAIIKKIDVLNLSIGGPDFMDIAFVRKVREVTSKRIIMVSGIGNDGPLYGTLNNPADQLDVIGVGGLTEDDKIAKFSSRGMTTWELPFGYGRVKPDIVTLATNVVGLQINGSCRTLSGTSVASPIVAGSITLLLSSLSENEKRRMNPASIKQILMASADRIKDANMFEQGFGKLNLIKAYKYLKNYKNQVSTVPSYIDLTECPYFWPYCTQPLYYSGMPIFINVTILNPIKVSGKIQSPPKWYPSRKTNGHFLKLNFAYPTVLWPWSGYLSIGISVDSSASEFEGIVDGLIRFKIHSDSNDLLNEINLYVKAKIISTPSRKQRILWDQFHNLRYPAGYFPKDDLTLKNEPLDWNGDHIHTNFRDLYQYLRDSGYFVETLGHNYMCFNASNYAILMIVDPEDEFFNAEIKKLENDILKNELSLIIFADWYNTSVMKAAKFYEDNSRKWVTPLTGGSNIPALNDLLRPFGIAFGDKIYDGEFKIGEHVGVYSSGTSITMFPKSQNNYLIYRNLRNEGDLFLAEMTNKTLQQVKYDLVPILGLAQPNFESGRIVVYGDSNCIDSSHMKKDCFWLISALIEYASHNVLYSAFKESSSENFINQNFEIERLKNSEFESHSKILSKNREIYLHCPILDYESNFYIDLVDEVFLPNKRNSYNFLKIVNISSLTIDEINEYNKDTDQNLDFDENENYQVKNEVKNNSSLNIFELSLVPSIAIIIVIFVLYKIFFRRIRLKNKRANFKK